LDQPLIALGEILRTQGIRLGASKRGSIRSIVNLIELLSPLDLGTLHKQALLDDAAHLRAHFSDARSDGAARQVRRKRYITCFDGIHAHLGRRHRQSATCLLVATTTNQSKGGNERKRKQCVTRVSSKAR